jgi:hypothetical protein
MANHHTLFSCSLDVGSLDNVNQAISLHNALVAQGGDILYNTFQVSAMPAVDVTEICIFSEDAGNVDAVLEYVRLCARKFDLQGDWGFTYAETCSKPRVGEFGGGAIIMDLSQRALKQFVNATQWLQARLPSDESSTVVPSSDDDIATLRHHRDLLSNALKSVFVSLGIVPPDISLTDPQLLMVAQTFCEGKNAAGVQEDSPTPYTVDINIGSPEVVEKVLLRHQQMVDDANTPPLNYKVEKHPDRDTMIVISSDDSASVFNIVKFLEEIVVEFDIPSPKTN